MSITWFVTPYDPKHWQDPLDRGKKPTSDLHVDGSEFYQFARSRVPELVDYNPGASFSMYKISNDDGTTLRVNLYQGNQIISLDNTPTPPFFDFVLAYRAFVSAQYPLFFFNSSSWDSLQLTSKTTKQDLRKFMGYVG